VTIWNDLAPVAHRMELRSIDGVTTRVLELGRRDAPAVVCLHGVGGHLEAFARNVVSLSAAHRVVAYDLPGHGYSDGPAARSYEIDGYVSHLCALLGDLGIGTADLVGVSLGGWVAARLAHDRPELVDRLVLVGTGGATYDTAVMQSLRTLSTAAASDPSRDNVRQRLEWLMADPATVTDELVEARQAIYAQPGFADRMARVLCLQDPDVRRANLLPPEVWGAITAPSLVVWGSHDRTGPLEKGREIARMLPNGELLALTPSGHWPQFESAAEFNSAVAEFLGEKGPT